MNYPCICQILSNIVTQKCNLLTCVSCECVLAWTLFLSRTPDNNTVTKKRMKITVFWNAMPCCVRTNFLLHSHYNIIYHSLSLQHTTRRHEAGLEVWLHSFLTSALDRGEWLTSCPGQFTSEDRVQYSLNRRLGGPQSHSIHVEN